MATNFLAPTQESLQEMLGMFFGEGTAIEPTDAHVEGGHVAVFIDDENQPVARCTASTELANFSGAAFSMIAKDVAEEAIRDGELSGMIADNYHEIMNLCSKLFMDDNTPHLRLDSVSSEGESLAVPAVRYSFTVDVPNYGGGVISFDVS